MRKRLILPLFSILLAALTLIGASALDFQDVPPSHWGHSAVNWAYEEGLMSGLSDTVFDPDGNMTRSMFVSVLYRLTVKRGGDVTTTRETAFPDIPADSTAWYAESAFWAAENGIVAGLADGSFGVNVPISREQMAAIVCRYIENYLNFSLKTYEGEITFHDSAAISPWALDSVAKFQNMGIVVGDGSGNYRPTANTTRAAVAVIFRNLSDFLTRVVDNHVHTFEEVSRQDATCTVPGSVVSVCTVCEQQKTELLPALGHTVAVDAAVAATCTETGLTEGSHCSVCGEVLVAQTVVPMLPHTVVTDDAVAATCTETGLTEGSHCSVCGEVLVAQTVVEILPHTVVTDDAVAATCTETGLSEGSHCSVCGEILVAQTVVEKLPHTVVTDDAVAATCTETGLTEGSHCSVCNTVLVAQTVVPMLPHTVVTDDAVAATCTETGLSEGSHCSVCGEVLVAQTVVEILPHTVVTDDAVAATCTETGLTEGSHCSVCGEILVAQTVVEKLPHTVVTDDAVAATCAEAGLSEGSHCSVCGEILVAQTVVEKLPHTVVTDDAVAATCTETGLTEGSHCSVCNTVLVAQQTVAALGHDFGAWTEINDLEERRDCSRCDVYETREKPAPLQPYVYVLANSEKLMRDAIPAPQTETILRGKAGRNEGEGMQFVLRFDQNVTDVWYEVSPLTDGQGHSLNTVECYRQHYIEHTADYGAFYRLAALMPKGYYPEALIPIYDGSDGGYDNQRSDIPFGQNQGYWITVWTDMNQTPGTYRGNVTVHYAEGEDIVIPVSFEVWDITVPVERSCTTAFAEYEIPNWYAKNKVNSLVIEKIDLNMMFYDFAEKYRLTVTDIPSVHVPSDGTVQFSSPDILEDWFESIREVAARPECSGFRVPYYGSSTELSPADYRLRELLLQYDLIDKAYYYDLDEPLTMAPIMGQKLRMRDALNPEMNDVVTTNLPAFDGSVRTWCPKWINITEDWVRGKISEGCNVWWYGCLDPTPPAATYQLVDYLTSARMVHWMQKDLGISGELYWNMTYWSKNNAGNTVIRDVYSDPYSAQVTLGYDEFAGDGILIYPGYRNKSGSSCDGYVNRNIPVPTVKLEAIRDGFEDFEYLTMMEEKLQTKMTALGITEYTTDDLLDTYYTALYRQGEGADLTACFDHENAALIDTVREILARDLIRQDDDTIVALFRQSSTEATIRVFTQGNDPVTIDGVAVEGVAMGQCTVYEAPCTVQTNEIRQITVTVGDESYTRILNGALS